MLPRYYPIKTIMYTLFINNCHKNDISTYSWFAKIWTDELVGSGLANLLLAVLGGGLRLVQAG